MYAEIVFDVPLNQRFTYLVPQDLQDAMQPGIRILAPFGKRILTGYVVGIPETPPEDIELKKIADILDQEPVISMGIMQLAEWIAEYYLCGFGEALKAALPAGTSIESKRTVRLIADDLQLAAQSLNGTQAKIIRILREKGTIRIETLQQSFRSTGIAYGLRKLEEKQLIVLESELRGRAHHTKIEKYVRLTTDANAAAKKPLTTRQQHIVDYLIKSGGSARQAQLLKTTKSATSTLKVLAKAHRIELYERRIERDYYGDLSVPPAPKLILNQEQQQAVDRICKMLDTKTPHTFLIHGVTGSGKTQVYIESIRHAIADGKSAIVLVPEIALTPQTVRRFRAEFQDMVTVMHSRMSIGERYDAWQKIHAGRARVVVGPRSAIFAPVKNLGLIVVDEEHESSYKQSDSTPRYHARDVAVMRAVFSNAVVLLGSATPSMESYQNALRGKYTLLEMLKRIEEIPLPRVYLINLLDARAPKGQGDDFFITPALQKKIEEKLALREQVIILQNRRGFSTAVQCTECGYVETCPNCNVSLSYHLKGWRMRCHYCDLNQKAPNFCPNCQSAEIRYRGIGTQKVEMQLQELLPKARIARMDLDTTRGKRAHDKILQDFGEHKYDILVGTQMIAKGLDFPKVTLVGVISADTGLYLPDFRASEKTFQLITQVAGRAGRKGGQGEVFIQTYSSGHFCLRCAQQHDFKQFYFQEQEDRRTLHYPPFGRLALLQLRHKDEQKAWHATLQLASLLRTSDATFDVLGPSPAPLAKLQQYFRFQILLKNNRKMDASASRMRTAIRQAVEQFRQVASQSGVTLTVDVDPLSIL